MKQKINMLDEKKKIEISTVGRCGERKSNKKIEKIKQGGKEVIQNKRKNQKKQRGITLVALVVTIVILIILATITINVVFDDGGLIDIVKGAKNDAENLVQSEDKKMNDLLQEYANIIGSNSNNQIDTNNWDKNNVKPEKTEDGTIVPVPVGFVVSKASGEKRVDDGLVIYEGTEDVTDYNVDIARKERNQFVWIPVNGNNYLTSDDSMLYDIDSNIEEENKLINESIKKYGGYFISRYEIANDNNKYISKQGYIPDTNVTLNESINNSRSMYVRDNESYGATSTLVYGKQWDLLMDNLSGKYDIDDSSNYGNYYDFNLKNINIANRNNIYNRLTNYNYQYKIKQVALAQLDIESSTDILNPVLNSCGGIFTINYSIGVTTGSIDAYVRFKIGDSELIKNIQISENENIIKKGEYYYYKLPLASNESMNVKITFEVTGNSSLETMYNTLTIYANAIQAKIFEPDFSLDDPWKGEGLYQARRTNNIISVSNFKIEDETKLAYLSAENSLNINITINPNVLQKTGSSEFWKVKNIYDLAGNIEEWTIDVENNKYITRGGKYYEKSGKETPINSLNLIDKSGKADYIGYRAILYIK